MKVHVANGCLMVASRWSGDVYLTAYATHPLFEQGKTYRIPDELVSREMRLAESAA